MGPWNPYRFHLPDSRYTHRPGSQPERSGVTQECRQRPPKPLLKYYSGFPYCVSTPGAPISTPRLPPLFQIAARSSRLKSYLINGSHPSPSLRFLEERCDRGSPSGSLARLKLSSSYRSERTQRKNSYYLNTWGDTIVFMYPTVLTNQQNPNCV